MKRYFRLLTVMLVLGVLGSVADAQTPDPNPTNVAPAQPAARGTGANRRQVRRARARRKARRQNRKQKRVNRRHARVERRAQRPAGA